MVLRSSWNAEVTGLSLIFSLSVSRGIFPPWMLLLECGLDRVTYREKKKTETHPALPSEALALGITAVKQKETCFTNMVEALSRDNQQHLRRTEGGCIPHTRNENETQVTLFGDICLDDP